MSIKRMSATIDRVEDLSPTAREVTLRLPEPLGFLPGAFVNVFVDKDGTKERRAYSISSDHVNQQEITLSIRKTTPESVSALFWHPDVTGLPLTLMGPLGLNTADKIEHDRVFLFAFGIGISVVKSLMHYLVLQDHIRDITVVTGSRTEDEILYRRVLEEIAHEDARVQVRFVVSRPYDTDYAFTGYVQDHIGDFNFAHSTVYICGQKKSCALLQQTIEAKTDEPVQFLIEAFD